MQQRRGRRGVGEGAQHARDVAQRRALAAALDQRPRRLALEVQHDPVAVGGVHHLAEVVVAVVADDAPGRADLGEHPQLLAHLLAAAADRRQDVEAVGKVEEDALDLLVDGRGQQAQRLGRGLLGRERRVGVVGAQRGVQATGDLAQRACPRDEARRILAQVGERQVPAVGRARQEVLDDAERRVDQPARVAVPAAQRGDVREVALGEEAQDLQLGVGPGAEAAVGLEHEPLVEHDRGVGLLGAHRADLGDLGAQAPRRPRGTRRSPDRSRSRCRRRSGARADGPSRGRSWRRRSPCPRWWR